MTASRDDAAAAATSDLGSPPLVRGLALDDTVPGAPTLRLASGRWFRISGETLWLLRRLEAPTTWDELAADLARRVGTHVSPEQTRALVRRLLIEPGLLGASPGPHPGSSPAAPEPAHRAAILLASTWTRRLSAALAPVLARDVQGVTAAAALAAHVAWLAAGDAIGDCLRAPLRELAWLPVVLLPAVFVHELGHAAACRAHGGETGAVRLGRARISLELSGLDRMTPEERAAVFVAGPVAQLLWGAAVIAVFAAFGAQPPALAVVANLLIAAANLAPIDGRDGERLAVELAGGAPRDPTGPQVADAPAAVRLRALGCVAAWAAAAGLLGLVGSWVAADSVTDWGAGAMLAAFALGGVSCAVLGVRLMRLLLGDEPDAATETAALPVRLRAAAVYAGRVLRARLLVTFAAGKMRRERAMLPALAAFAFPGWSSRELRRLGDRSAVSMELLEREHGDLARRELAHVLRHAGTVRDLIRERRGAVVCALHFGTFHYVVRTLMHLRIQPVVFAARSTHAHWAQIWKRAVGPGEQDPLLLDPQQTTAGLRAYRALREGRLLVVYIDAHIAAGAAAERRVPVPFLGQTLYLRTGPMVLASRSGAQIVLAASPRRAFGMRLVAFSEPLPPPEAGDEATVQRYLADRYAWFEPWVERYPEQWAGNLMRFDHWREVGAPPRVTASAWDAERSAWRRRLEHPGRGVLVVDSARVGWFETRGTRLIVDGPHGRVLKGSALALELLDAAERRTPLARLARTLRRPSTPIAGGAPPHGGDYDAVVDELSRLTLAGLVGVRESRRSPSATAADPAPATPA